MAEEQMDLVAGRSGMPKVPSVLEGVKTAADWQARRRRILGYLEEEMYGRIPPRPERMSFTVDWEKPVFDGLGICRQVNMRFGVKDRELELKALWYLPAKGDRVPCVCALNFCGNAGTSFDPDIYQPASEADKERGWQVRRWSYQYLLEQGISCLTAARNDFFPDSEAGRYGSVFRLFHKEAELTPEHREYTAISAWAWGYSRLLDLALTDPRIDERRVWVHGHSRLGKTALWVGAHDLRFAGVVSNDSGCCGASIERDHHANAENLERITRTFHRWFVAKFDQWVNRADEMPFDMNWLVSLTAPRPVLIASASEDVWADPFNEFRCAKQVGEVYRLFGAQGLPDDAQFPAPNEAVIGDRVAYELREGKHDVTLRDWEVLVEFMKSLEKQAK